MSAVTLPENLARARDSVARELRALDALLAWTEGGAPTCRALLNAWHAVAALDALLRGRHSPTYDEFAEALGRGEQPASYEGAHGARNAVDPRLLAAACAPAGPPADWPERGAILRQRHALVARADELGAELRSRYPKPPLRRVRVVAVALVALLTFVFWFAWRPAVWRVEYFRTPFLTDSIASDLTAQVGGDWGNYSPHAGVPDDDFSSRWDTCLVLGRAMEVAFRLGSDDGSRLIVDDHTIIDQWRSQEYAEQTASILLVEGEHHVRVEYFEAAGTAKLLLQARLDAQGAFASLPRRLLHAPRSGPAPCSR